jgi:hypothetical protein
MTLITIFTPAQHNGIKWTSLVTTTKSFPSRPAKELIKGIKIRLVWAGIGLREEAESII